MLMVRMIFNEFTRVLRDRTTLCIIIVLILANAFVAYTNEIRKADADMCPPEDYRQIYDDISQMSDEDSYVYVKNIYDEMMQDETMAHYTEAVPYGVVLDELEQCVSYDTYYSGIMEAGDRRAGIAIFAGKDTYSDENMSKTVEAFKPLKGLKLQHGPSAGINMVTGNMAVNIIGVMMLLVIATALISKDTETGMGKLIRTLKSGRMKLTCARICTMILYSIISVIVLYLPLIIIAGIMYGYGNPARAVQSVSGFMTTNLQISVIKFAILFIITKMCVFLLCGILFMAVMSIFNFNVPSFAVLVLLFGISALAYYKIRDNSTMELVKNVNLYAYLDTVRLFNSYRNLKVWGRPVNYLNIFKLMMTVSTTALIIIMCIIGSRKREISSGSCAGAIKYGMVNLWNRTGVNGLFRNELYKTLIYRKGVIILVLCGLIIAVTYTPIKSIYGSIEDVYYKMALQKGTEGAYSPDKEQIMEQELDTILSGTNPNIDIENWSKAYEKMRDNAEYAKKLQKGYLIYDRGYGLLTGQDVQTELLLGAECIIMTILAVFSIWSVEYTCHMDVIINASCKGQRKVMLTKMLIAMVMALIVFLGVHIPWICNVLKAYGTDYINIPAANLHNLKYVPENISILQYIIIRTAVKYAALAGIVVLIRLIAKKTRSHMQTMVISAVLFVAPILIMIILEGIRA